MRDLYLVLYQKILTTYQKKHPLEYDEIKDEDLLGYKLRFRIQDILRIQK